MPGILCDWIRASSSPRNKDARIVRRCLAMVLARQREIDYGGCCRSPSASLATQFILAADSARFVHALENAAGGGVIKSRPGKCTLCRRSSIKHGVDSTATAVDIWRRCRMRWFGVVTRALGLRGARRGGRSFDRRSGLRLAKRVAKANATHPRRIALSRTLLQPGGEVGIINYYDRSSPSTASRAATRLRDAVEERPANTGARWSRRWGSSALTALAGIATPAPVRRIHIDRGGTDHEALKIQIVVRYTLVEVAAARVMHC